jgi:hypothetical protein
MALGWLIGCLKSESAAQKIASASSVVAATDRRAMLKYLTNE